MQRAANRATSRRLIQKVLSEGELALMADLVSPNAANHELIDAFGSMAPPGRSAVPSGHAIDVCAIRVERFANGKIVESWCLLDSLKLLQQLGALPRLQRRPAAQPQRGQNAQRS